MLKKLILTGNGCLLLVLSIFSLSGCGNDNKSKEVIVEPVEYDYQVPESLADGWQVASLYESDFDVDKVETLIAAIKNGKYPEIDSILVAQSGSLLLEEYFNGYSASKLHQTQSAIKSFDSAVVGILQDQHYLSSLDQPIEDYLPELQDVDWSGAKGEITLEDLLTMRSGLDCLETNSNGCNSTNINQSHNWAKFTLSQSMVNQPGTFFSYFSGLPLVMHRIVENQTGQSYKSFIDQYLLAPLGIVNYRFDHSPAGETLNAHMLPRDMAKFGQLYLNKGQWQGQQLISPYWVERSTQPSVEDGQWLERFKYGYWWWLFDGEKAGKAFNFIGARGSYGQWIILMPEQELLLVFTGNKDTEAVFDIIEQYFYLAE